MKYKYIRLKINLGLWELKPVIDGNSYGGRDYSFLCFTLIFAKV